MIKSIKLSILAAAAALSFTACQSGSTTTEQAENTASAAKADTVASVAAPTATNQLVGGGNEPGWNITLLSDAAAKTATYDFTTNYGEVKLSGSLQQVQPASTETSATKWEGTDSEGNKLTVLYNTTPCTDDADRQFPGTLVVTWKDQTLHGCGSLGTK